MLNQYRHRRAETTVLWVRVKPFFMISVFIVPIHNVDKVVFRQIMADVDSCHKVIEWFDLIAPNFHIDLLFGPIDFRPWTNRNNRCEILGPINLDDRLSWQAYASWFCLWLHLSSLFWPCLWLRLSSYLSCSSWEYTSSLGCGCDCVYLFFVFFFFASETLSFFI